MAKIYVTGDILNEICDHVFIDKSMQKIIKDSDYSVCNFEAPIDVKSNPIEKAGPPKKQAKNTIKILKQVGFDLLLLSNNHIYDYGQQGLGKTLNEAKKVGISTIGAEISFKETYKPKIKILNGIKFGFINACEAQFGQFVDECSNLGGYCWINHRYINEIVIDLKKQVDYVVFFAHAGLENYDIPLIEWRNRYKELCDIGVDCLIGSHPHVAQGFEKYNDKYIFYSLGNYYFVNSSNSKKKEFGYSLMLEFEIGKKIKFNIIYHIRQGLNLKRINSIDSPISFIDLNNKLANDNYLNIAKKMYLEAYYNPCLIYYAEVFKTVVKSDTTILVIKRILKNILLYKRTKKNRNLLFLHLLRNETYRYITIKALEIQLLENN